MATDIVWLTHCFKASCFFRERRRWGKRDHFGDPNSPTLLTYRFYNGGLLFSIAGIIGWALISLWSFLLLVQTRLVIHASFGDMGGVLYGPRMKRAVLIAITLSQIGFVCAYMVFVAENLQALLLAFSKCRVLIPMHLLILAQSFAFIPLAMIRKIQRLSVFALIADVFIVIGLLYLFYYDIQRLTTAGVGNITYWNSVQFPLFIGTVAFTYEGIGLGKLLQWRKKKGGSLKDGII